MCHSQLLSKLPELPQAKTYYSALELSAIHLPSEAIKSMGAAILPFLLCTQSPTHHLDHKWYLDISVNSMLIN